MSPPKRLQARITGRVQGVGFRYFVEREARRLGLTGWVQNTPDGGVELMGEGDEAVLQQLLERCRQGPPAAAVRSVQASWSEAVGNMSGFRVRG